MKLPLKQAQKYASWYNYSLQSLNITLITANTENRSTDGCGVVQVYSTSVIAGEDRGVVCLK